MPLGQPLSTCEGAPVGARGCEWRPPRRKKRNTKSAELQELAIVSMSYDHSVRLFDTGSVHR